MGRGGAKPPPYPNNLVGICLDCPGGIDACGLEVHCCQVFWSLYMYYVRLVHRF